MIWSGSQQIDNSFSVIEWLTSLNKQIFFISNSSGKTQGDYVRKIQSYGYKQCKES